MSKQTLTYRQALDALDNGKKVRLPEWTGYWFNNGNGTQVFTRTGDVLDAPNYENYSMRNDWELVEAGMGFDFAMLAIKDGKLVCRAGWNGKGMFIFQRPADELEVGFIVNTVKSLPQALKDYYQKQVTNPDSKVNYPTKIKFSSYLCMKAADDSIVNGWLASQTDMMATDWEVVS